MSSKQKASGEEGASEDPTNAFADCKLNREAAAKQLTAYVRQTKTPQVISLNGAWGTGKTFFLQRWAKSLKQHGIDPICFSAWEDDHLNDPLVAIIGQLWEQMKGSVRDEVGQDLKDSLGKFCLNTAKNIIRAGTAGAVDLEKDSFISIAKNTVEDYKDATAAVKDLKARLEDLAAKVAKSQRESQASPAADTESAGFPLIIIIDELDRCRPTFAIELLERVKHLFSVPGIIFVLGVDRQQLGHSIRAVCGSGMDVDGYLRRFMDIEFNLPPIERETFIKHALSQHSKVSTDDTQKQNEATAYYLVPLTVAFDLSLRDVEYCSKLLAMNQPPCFYEYLPLMCLLVVLKAKRPDVYGSYIQGNTSREVMFKMLVDKVSEDSVFLKASWWRVLAAVIIVFDYNTLQTILQQYSQAGANPRIDEDRWNKWAALVRSDHQKPFIDGVSALLRNYENIACSVADTLVQDLSSKLEIMSVVR